MLPLARVTYLTTPKYGNFNFAGRGRTLQLIFFATYTRTIFSKPNTYHTEKLIGY